MSRIPSKKLHLFAPAGRTTTAYSVAFDIPQNLDTVAVRAIVSSLTDEFASLRITPQVLNDDLQWADRGTSTEIRSVGHFQEYVNDMAMERTRLKYELIASDNFDVNAILEVNVHKRSI